MTAVISPCGLYRYRLEREVQLAGLVYAYFGVNGSTATADVDDQTVRKWIGFTQRNNGRRFIVGNAFAYRATNVRELAQADDPVGPDNNEHLRQIIADADVLVPCFGNQSKVPNRLRPQFDVLCYLLFSAAKPVKVFGLSKGGDPLHPLMLSYDRPLIDWEGYAHG